MQETYREEDYAFQLIEGFYRRVVLVTTLFWGNIDRFCICGWKFPQILRTAYSRHKTLPDVTKSFHEGCQCSLRNSDLQSCQLND